MPLSASPLMPPGSNPPQAPTTVDHTPDDGSHVGTDTSFWDSLTDEQKAQYPSLTPAQRSQWVTNFFTYGSATATAPAPTSTSTAPTAPDVPKFTPPGSTAGTGSGSNVYSGDLKDRNAIIEWVKKQGALSPNADQSAINDPGYWADRIIEKGGATADNLGYFGGRILNGSSGASGSGGNGSTYQRVASPNIPGFGGFGFAPSADYSARQFNNPYQDFAYSAYNAPSPYTAGVVRPGGTGVGQVQQPQQAPPQYPTNYQQMFGGQVQQPAGAPAAPAAAKPADLPAPPAGFPQDWVPTPDGQGWTPPSSDAGQQTIAQHQQAMDAYTASAGAAPTQALPAKPVQPQRPGPGAMTPEGNMGGGGFNGVNGGDPSYNGFPTDSGMYDASGNWVDYSGGRSANSNLWGQPQQPQPQVQTSDGRWVDAPQSIVAPTTGDPNSITAPTVSRPGAITARNVAAPGAVSAPSVNVPGATAAHTITAPSQIQAGTVTAPQPFQYGQPVPDSSSVGAPPQPGTFDYSKLQTPDLYTAMQAFQAPTLNETNDPGYQFRLSEGNRAIQNNASAQGVRGGDVAKAMQDYAQNYASSEYGNVYNRSYNEWLGQLQNQLGAYQTNASTQMAANQQQFGQGQSAYQTNTQTQQTAYNQALALYNQQLAAQQQGYGQAYNAAALNTSTSMDAQKTNIGNQLTADQTNALYGMNTQQFNAGQMSAADQQTVANRMAAEQMNAGFGLTAQQINAANQLDASKANAQYGLTADQANASNLLSYENANAGYNLAAQQSNTANQLTVAQQNALMNYNTQQANAGNRLAADTSNAGMSLSAQQANQQAQFNAYQANVQNALNAYTTNYGVAANTYNTNFNNAFNTSQANASNMYNAAALNASNTNTANALGWQVASGTYDRNYQNLYNQYQSDIQQNQYAAGLDYQYAGLGLAANNQSFNQALSTYNANLAGQGQAFDQSLATYGANQSGQQQQYNQIYGQQQLGLQALGLYTGAGTGYGNSVGNLYTGIGNSQAAGQIGQANAYGGLLNNAAAYALYYGMPQQPGARTNAPGNANSSVRTGS